MPRGRRRVYSIRAVHRVCDILDLVQERAGGFTLTQVAEATGFPKSSGYRYLATLIDHRYVIKDPESGFFRIGPAFLPTPDERLIALADRVRPFLSRLRDQVQETVNLGALDGGRVSYVEIFESPHCVRLAARPGDRDALHCSALGKAIGAQLSHDAVGKIIEVEGLPRHTPHTITTMVDYEAELAKIRKDGYALDNCESEIDGRCVAVALPDVVPPAAISISAPATRFPVEDVPEYAKALRETMRLLQGKAE
ncbi:IclR family transcriptional regulator [Phytoactinopolyspora limicola]|uniref:IclR family transcriptional regulator n=1 Tax=Phytoactinopolyspora limicola TaxID=2715536 RepID=UPI00140C8DEB|nr:IclR family transcriptional regulator [Phytoactinopolyspora limicola]